MTESVERVTVQCVRCGKDVDVDWFMADCSIICTCAQEAWLYTPFCEEFNTLMTKLEQRV